MSTRIWKFVIPVVICFHFILYFTFPSYQSAWSISALFSFRKRSWTIPNAVPLEYYVPEQKPLQQSRRANAALVMLARNYEIPAVLSAMKQVEDRFNKNFGYPWVFLNEVPFTKEFKTKTREITSANVTYQYIPAKNWYQPDWIDEDKAHRARQELEKLNVLYATSVSYRNMCRFNSGFFFQQEVLLPYRYYWRIEPGVQFFCDINEDPFLYLQDNNKVYGFTMSMYDYPETIPTLWETVKNFTDEHPEYIASDNSMKFISKDSGKYYNLCHFWSNFEIGDMEFFRSQAYVDYFEHLDKAGGFYYERWGDAPVHSIALALFANKSQLHFFDEIGYRHEPFQHCPQGELHTKGRCSCSQRDTFDRMVYSCTKQFMEMFN